MPTRSFSRYARPPEPPSKSRSAYSGSAYLEALWRPTPDWLIRPGVREDVYHDHTATKSGFDPRLTVRYKLGTRDLPDVRPFLASHVPQRNPLLNPVQVEARFSKLRRLPGMEEIEGELRKVRRLLYRSSQA